MASEGTYQGAAASASEAVEIKMPKSSRKLEADYEAGRQSRVSSWTRFWFAVVSFLLLIVILIPISFKTVEYYQYGLLRRSSTGKMKLQKVYDTGRYFLGPDYNFKLFQADAHFTPYHNLSVFSADRLECMLDIDLVYYINKSELIKLHNTYERSYRQVVDGRVQDAIKNTAPKFTTAKFFTDRESVQAALFAAVQERLKEVFCVAEEMYLQLVTIPDEVAARQLKTAVQLENNIKEGHVSTATQIRQQTIKLVNDINNNATLIQQKAYADANYTIAVADAESRQIVSTAQSEGLAYMYKKLNVSSDEHKSSLDYIRTLRTNPAASINIGYSLGTTLGTKISSIGSTKTPTG